MKNQAVEDIFFGFHGFFVSCMAATKIINYLGDRTDRRLAKDFQGLPLT